MRTVGITITVEGSFNKTADEIIKSITQGVEQITTQAYEEWQSEAGRKLHTTRRRYQDALHHSMTGPFSSEITLYARDKKTDWIITALERGSPPFSIRDAVLKKAKLQTGRTMSARQRHRMFAYLASVGRLGLPPTPFSDVPFRSRRTLEPGDPEAYKRISKNTPPGKKWKHPGLKPVGKGGPGPLRPAIVEYIKKVASDVIGPIISKVTV